MLIECKLHRKDGTKVRIDKTDYHFAPDKDGAHVANVTDPKHIQKFLAIPEAYAEKGTPEPDEPDTSLEDEANNLFPLADAEIDKFTNKDLTNAAAKHLGITGTNKDLLASYALDKLEIADLATRDPKASYVSLVREVLLAVQARQREERAEFLANEEAGND